MFVCVQQKLITSSLQGLRQTSLRAEGAVSTPQVQWNCENVEAKLQYSTYINKRIPVFPVHHQMEEESCTQVLNISSNRTKSVQNQRQHIFPLKRHGDSILHAHVHAVDTSESMKKRPLFSFPFENSVNIFKELFRTGSSSGFSSNCWYKIIIIINYTH